MNIYIYTYEYIYIYIFIYIYIYIYTYYLIFKHTNVMYNNYIINKIWFDIV